MLADKVFVVGCGRTGTHWIAAAVASFGRVSGTNEDMLGLPGDRAKPLGQLRALCEKFAYEPAKVVKKDALLVHSLYQHLHEVTAKGGCYVDKTHGFIWGAEVLAELFPGAVFVGTTRGVCSTVASLVHREGSMKARRAGSKWRAYPLPCAPSGISRRVASECYSGLTIEERGALVWLAHETKMERLKKNLGERLLLVNYEATLKDPASTLDAIRKHVGAEDAGRIEPPHPEANEKWKREFTMRTAERVLKVAAGEYYVRECQANAFWHEKVLEGVLG